MTMRLRFWGTRGSIPTPGPHTYRYGGNTPCVEVRTDTGGLVILDAGTGIRELGQALVKGDASGAGVEADIFLTHAHWDHIQGIPFFAPIFQPESRLTIWASDSLPDRLDRVIRDLMSPVVFPVGFDDVKATVTFRELGDGGWHRGDGYEVSAIAVQHPGGALGYRFAGASGSGGSSGSFVYISDNELAASEGYAVGDNWRSRLVEFARGATLLVHDATYTADEYERHRGWGHSTYEDAVELALAAEVEHLVLFHHKPERSDDAVDENLAHCQAFVASRGSSLRISAASEGMELTV